MEVDVKQNKCRFSLIVEQILVFASSTDLLREMKIKPPTSRQIAWQCF